MGAPQYEQAGADVAGTGTANYVAKWTGGSTLGNSIIFDNGTNVGIGTASPNKKLQVVDGASGEVRFTTTANVAGNTITQRFSSNAAAGAYEGGGAYIQAIQGAGIDIWSLAFGTANVSATSSEQMRITSTGSVGIGTASPGAQLQVERAGGLSNAEYLRLRNTSTGSGSAVGQDYYVHANTVATGRIQHTWTGTTYDTSFSVWNNTLSSLQEAMRIQGGGNLLMAGGGTAAAPIIANSTGVSGMYFPSASTVAIAANGAIAATFSKVAGAGVALGGTTGLVFDASGTQQGLKLPSTPGNADTQTLDCYQENTWTPELRFGGASTGITYTVRSGYYTRVGNLVTVQCYFVLSSKGTATGVATIANLPATVSSSAGAFAGAAIGWIQNITYTSFPAFHANVGTTDIILWNPASGGAGAQLTDAQFAATSGVIFTMTYRV